jgi:signal transduction histidine kinase
MSLVEEALLRALTEERRLAEERALIPGLLQHDLSNVLCQVGLSANTLETASDPEMRDRAMRDVNGGLKRMGELLSGMRFLYLTRGGVLDYARGDLVAFVSQLVEEPGVWPKGAPITTDLPPSMWCTFSPTLVRHALVNLIGNAVAYSNGTWVRVRLSPVCGASWQMSVANGGPGIPANHLPYLFELGRPTKVAPQDGSPGLGLYIARLCVRLHGSVLRVRARPGLTVFAFPVEGVQRGAAPVVPPGAASHAA